MLTWAVALVTNVDRIPTTITLHVNCSGDRVRQPLLGATAQVTLFDFIMLCSATSWNFIVWWFEAL